MSVLTTTSISFDTDDSDYNSFLPIEVSDVFHQSDFNDNLGNTRILADDSDFETINDNNSVNIEDDGVRVIEDSDEDNRSKGKKKRTNVSRWKRNVCKHLNASGVELESLLGKHVMPRVTGPDCKCVNKCFIEVLDSGKNKILNTFNNIGHKEKQDTFLGGLIKVNKIVRNRPKDSSKPKSCACVNKIIVD